jgi:hypothetical protein
MEPHFELYVTVNNNRFRIQVFKIDEGESLERFKVVGGKHFMFKFRRSLE